MKPKTSINEGILYGIGAYTLWGFFPVYWKLLRHVSALQLVGHRIGWSFLLLIAIILFTKQWKSFQRSALAYKTLRTYFFAAVLIGVNWLTYIWAVNAGHIVEASLGYFINPLFSVLLGAVFFRERLRSAQWITIGIAAAGVIYLAFVYGSVPWIALMLAATFSLYGLVKKIAPLGSLYGLTLETGILFLPALAYLFLVQAKGSGAFLNSGTSSDLLIIGAGAVTTIPLLMFASAAKRIPLSLVGILQYISPTLQFLLGVVVYSEQFDATRLAGFCIVWSALIIFWVENYLHHRQPVQPLPELGEG
jgi:chloramphenicol-sensitive protein RarD